MKKLIIFIFSGSGNTKYLTEFFKEELSDNFSVEVKEVDKIIKQLDSFDDDFDIAGFIYPVHALNAPAIFFKFIKKYLPDGKNRNAFLVRSPGDPFFDGGYCGEVKTSLKNRSYKVFHESMVVMPANIFMRYKDSFIKEILEAAKKRVKYFCREIASFTPRKQNAGFMLKLNTFISSRIENLGAPLFGKDLKIKNNCTKCGKCVKNCPTENISMRGNKPRFGWKCIICMRCIYTCPVDAITPVFFSFFKLKKRYDLKTVESEEINNSDTQYKNKKFYKLFKKYLEEINKK